MTKQDTPKDATDVLERLRQDHRKVRDLFRRFEQDQADLEDEENAGLVRTIALELMVHAALEEELFYPAAAEALGEEMLVDQALVEHQSARTLLDQLADGAPEEEMWTARVHVLGEYVAHHIQEEEDVLFPQLEKAGFDGRDLAARLETRKAALMEKAAKLDLKELAALAGGGATA